MSLLVCSFQQDSHSVFKSLLSDWCFLISSWSWWWSSSWNWWATCCVLCSSSLLWWFIWWSSGPAFCSDVFSSSSFFWSLLWTGLCCSRWRSGCTCRYAWTLCRWTRLSLKLMTRHSYVPSSDGLTLDRRSLCEMLLPTTFTTLKQTQNIDYWTRTFN